MRAVAIILLAWFLKHVVSFGNGWHDIVGVMPTNLLPSRLHWNCGFVGHHDKGDLPARGWVLEITYFKQ